MPFKILSINANGLYHLAKSHSLWKTAQKIDGNICVQETYFTSSNQPACSNKSLPHIYTAFFTSKKRGVLIAMKDTVKFQLSQLTLDPNGRYCILSWYALDVNVYAPNTRQIKFFHKLISIIKPIQKGHLVICLDCNLVPDAQLHSTSAAKCKKSPLQNPLVSQDLFDVCRCQHRTERDYTYFSPLHRSYSGIDPFLTDKWLFQKISTSEIHTTTWSDHAPISIVDSPQKQNTYLYRANPYIIQQTSYTSEISA